MKGKPEVTAVILNYRDPALTAKSVRAVLQASRKTGIRVQTVVVDNSAPLTGRRLKRILPKGTVLVPSGSNLGFAKGNNAGAERAQGRYLLFVNNDAFLTPECLDQAVKALRRDGRIGVWAPRLQFADGSHQKSCARFPTLRGLALEYLFRINRPDYPGMERRSGPVEVDSVTGACLFTPARVFRDVRGFDPDYFFQVEDVDLCRRIRNAGYRVVYDPRYPVVHLSGASQPWRWTEDPHLHRNRILYFRKNARWPAVLAASAIIGLGLAFRRILKMAAALCPTPGKIPKR